MYAPEFITALQNVSSIADLITISTLMETEQIQYAYPYQLKTLIIEYAKTVNRIAHLNPDKNDDRARSHQ